MKPMVITTGLLGVMLGLLGVMIVASDPNMGGLAVFVWLLGAVLILLGHVIGTTPETLPAQARKDWQVPTGTAVFCHYCGSPIAPGAVKCPGCGRSFQQSP